MAEDPKHPWGSGATRYRWRAPVAANVQAVLTRWPFVTANTYVCHPWCGWSRSSADFWGPRGRGDPLRGDAAIEIWEYLFNLSRAPAIRHGILDHWIWTSWGGYGLWSPNDHTGALRHLHVTWWRPVDA